jgi:hypothetical protein
MIDLGLLIVPSCVTIRHGAGGYPHWTKTFLFQVSKDGTHFIPCDIVLINESTRSTATWSIKNEFGEHSGGFRYLRLHQKSSRYPVCIAGLEVYGQVLATIDIRSSMDALLDRHSRLFTSIDVLFVAETEMARSRTLREDARNRSTNTRQAPIFHPTHSSCAATGRGHKVQSHILRRLASMRTGAGTSTSSSSSSSSNPNTHGSTSHSSGPSTLDRILFDQMIDLSSIPVDLSTGQSCSFLWCQI